MNLRRSALDTTFLTIRETADVPLDMTAPQVAFTLNSDQPSVWWDTDWVGNNQVDAAGNNYRVHRILIGPGPQATVALTPGRWLVWRQLVDQPEIPVGQVAGTITIF